MRQRSPRGFSLTELLAVLALLGFMLAAMAPFFDEMQRSLPRLAAGLRQPEILVAVHALRNDVQNAVGVDGSSAEWADIALVLHQSGGREVTFRRDRLALKRCEGALNAPKECRTVFAATQGWRWRVRGRLVDVEVVRPADPGRVIGAAGTRARRKAPPVVTEVLRFTMRGGGEAGSW